VADDQGSIAWFLRASGAAVEANKRKLQAAEIAMKPNKRRRNTTASMKHLDWQVFMDKKTDKKFKRYIRINKRRFCYIRFGRDPACNNSTICCRRGFT
jgi:hypothetical protein